MVGSHVFNQALNCPTYRIYVSTLVADGTCVLAIRRVALYDEALSETELARVHYLTFVASSFIPDSDWRAFAYHPEIVAGDVEWDATGGTCAASSWSETGCQRLALYILEIEGVLAEELFGPIEDSGRSAFWRRERLHGRSVA